jgi:hypothetical protein
MSYCQHNSAPHEDLVFIIFSKLNPSFHFIKGQNLLFSCWYLHQPSFFRLPPTQPSQMMMRSFNLLPAPMPLPLTLDPFTVNPCCRFIFYLNIFVFNETNCWRSCVSIFMARQTQPSVVGMERCHSSSSTLQRF